MIDPTAHEGSPRYAGWRVVAAASVAVFFVSAFFYTFPIFLKPLAAEFSWSRETASGAYAAMSLASAVSAPILGVLFDRWRSRWICGLSLGVAGAAFACLGTLPPTAWVWYIVFAAIGFAASGTSPIVYSRVIATWFDGHRGRALALMIAAGALGGIVMPPIAQALIEAVGWRGAYPILGGAVMLLSVPIVLRLVRERERGGSVPRDRDARAIVRDALRSRTLWTLIAVVFGTTLTINGAIVHLSALLTDRGVSPGRAALVVSMMGVASLCGRLTTGWLLDRFVATRVSFVLLTIAASGTIVLARADSFAAGLVAAALIGFGTGGEVDVIPYLLSRYFGLEALSTLFGVAWMAFGLAGAVGPIAMGRAHDATGSYGVVLIAMSAATLTIAALMLTLPAYGRGAESSSGSRLPLSS